MGIHERQQRATLIMEAAAKVFFVQGFHGTKMEHVARHAGVSKGMLYFYYKNKEDLYMALVHYAITEFIRFHEQTFKASEKENGLQRILFFLTEYFRYVDEHQEIQALISDYIQMANPARQSAFDTGLTAGMKESKYYQKILDDQFVTALMISNVIVEGVEDGSILNTTDPRIIYATLWSMVLGYEKLSAAEQYFINNSAVDMQLYQMDRNAWRTMIYQSVKSILTSRL